MVSHNKMLVYSYYSEMQTVFVTRKSTMTEPDVILVLLWQMQLNYQHGYRYNSLLKSLADKLKVVFFVVATFSRRNSRRLLTKKRFVPIQELFIRPRYE